MQGCGRFNPMSFRYCPNCGTKRYSEEKFSATEIQNIPYNKAEDFSREDEITEYLRKRNLLHLADKRYLISVRLENGNIVTVPLTGRQTSSDALRYLQNRGFLSKNKEYKFRNWPKADPCIGPWYQHVSACVCELSPNIIYMVERLEREDMVCLYGCPNAKAIIQGKRLKHVRIEVVDYEK